MLNEYETKQIKTLLEFSINTEYRPTKRGVYVDAVERALNIINNAQNRLQPYVTR